MTNILIIGGTSSLGAVLIPLMLELQLRVNIDVFVRNRPLDELNERQKQWRLQLSKYTNVIHDLPESVSKFSACIYMASKDNIPILQRLENASVPTFLIGSGAVIDWKHGRIPINPYIEGKLRAAQFASTVIHPGFYLPDATTRDVGSGLHVSTLRKIFGPHDSSFNYGKPKYLTNMSTLSMLIVKWVLQPEKYIGYQGAFGSDYAYTRQNIKDLDASSTKETCYEDEMLKTRRVFDMQNMNVLQCMKAAKAWTEQTNLK